MDRATVTGLVLAGGLARRMGGVDKGLQSLRGQPLIAHVIGALAPQVGALIINANRNAEAYAAFGHPLVADGIAGFAGPLAGLEAGLSACNTPLLVCVPCDAPFLPADLVIRLHAALIAVGADVAVAQSGGQLQPVFCLVRRELVADLRAWVADGGRRMESWVQRHNWAACAFDACPNAFANLNTAADLREFE